MPLIWLPRQGFGHTAAAASIFQFQLITFDIQARWDIDFFEICYSISPARAGISSRFTASAYLFMEGTMAASKRASG